MVVRSQKDVKSDITNHLVGISESNHFLWYKSFKSGLPRFSSVSYCRVLMMRITIYSLDAVLKDLV